MKICFENCEIDWEIINFISMPIITLFSVAIYYQALRISRKQNEVLYSQNIKPEFQKEIDHLELEGQNLSIMHKTSVVPSLVKEPSSYNALEAFDGFTKLLTNLQKNRDYISDWEERHNSNMEFTELTRKSYYHDIIFLISTTSYSWQPLSQYYSKIISVWKQIENSNMIKEDKFLTLNLLERKVVSKILEHYQILNYIGFTKFFIPFSENDTYVTWRKFEEYEIVKIAEEIMKLSDAKKSQNIF